MRANLLLSSLALAGCLGGYTFERPSDDGCREFDCLWQSELGAIERVGTWSENDPAFALVGDSVRVTRKLDVSSFPSCAAVSLVANLAPDSSLELLLDFEDDGQLESRLAIPTASWERHTFFVVPPAGSRHLRMFLEKHGAGEAAVSTVSISDGRESCLGQPPIKLGEGAACTSDDACHSGRCIVGECVSCSAGGCAEGARCRSDGDCSGGACAAGLCRACAATGSCPVGEGCSHEGQCAARSCTFGSEPSAISYPALDGTCGGCGADSECASGHCVLGRCTTCAADSDCSGGLRCRYADPFEAVERTCLPRFDGILPRGALCEEDLECEPGLRCTGAPMRAKRCGGACTADGDCAEREVCAETGSVPSPRPGSYELTTSYRQLPRARVRTCYAVPSANDGSSGCSVHAQCGAQLTAPYSGLGIACCQGSCSLSGVNLETGDCDNEVRNLFHYFVY